MATFSWSDGFHAAFGSCLPCYRPSSPDLGVHDGLRDTPGPHRIPRARPDELEGLLADFGDTDTEAETLSLHSNIGAGSTRRKKLSKKQRQITLFGWNLFGRAPIYLSEDGEDVLGRRERRKDATTSSSTLDSDAAPLDAAVIDGMSAAQLAEAARAVEEEERRRKEEKKQRKRERKQLKLTSSRLLDFTAGQDGFEGFQGSGQSSGHTSLSFTSQQAQDDGREQFGPFVGAHDDGEEDGADLDGELYSRRAGSSLRDGSDSRSRSSASLSNSDSPAHYNHHFTSQPTNLTPATSVDNKDSQRKHKKSSKSSKSNSNSSTSQSASIRSPTHAEFSASPAVASTVEALPSSHRPQIEDRINEITSNVNSGFPSTGFGGVRTKKADAGVFLAHRGNL